MRLVILGVGGMGAITLSKIIAQMCIEKGIPVRSSEIHGMAKKGGLVEIQMKIGEGKSGVVLKKTADFAIVLDESYKDYARSYLKNSEKGLIVLTEKDKLWAVKQFGDVRFATAFLLGRFIKSQSVFDKDDALSVLEQFKFFDKNKISFERGLS